MHLSSRFFFIALLLWTLPTVSAFSAGDMYGKKQDEERFEISNSRCELTRLQNQVIYMFRAVLGIETPDSTNLVQHTRQEEAFSVAWECWDDFDFGEREFVRRMAEGGVSPPQAFVVLHLSHRNRTRISVTEIAAFTQSEIAVERPIISRDEIHRQVVLVRQMLHEFNANDEIAPLARRLALCAASDLQHSVTAQEQGDEWLALRWARNAETTILSANAMRKTGAALKNQE
jgi:hypothetical protein